MFNSTILPPTEVLNNTMIDDEPLECPNGLFYDQNGTGICRPECGQFRRSSLVVEFFQILSVCTGFVASVIMFILAFTLQRKTL